MKAIRLHTRGGPEALVVTIAAPSEGTQDPAVREAFFIVAANARTWSRSPA